MSDPSHSILNEASYLAGHGRYIYPISLTVSGGLGRQATLTPSPADNIIVTGNGPIYLETPLTNAFGVENDDTPFAKELEEIFKDGTIDQKDFDKFRPDCGYKTCPAEHDRYDRLRKLYVSLKRFASMDNDDSVLSPFETACFNIWFKDLGRDQITSNPVTNAELMGAMLLCGTGNTDPDQTDREACGLKIKGERFMLVVHPNYFGQGTGATGNIEREMEKAKGSGIPVVVLLEPKRAFSDGYESSDGYIKNLDPTHFVASESGEHGIEFEGKEVIMVGGYFDRCFQRALKYLIRTNSGRDLTIRIPADSVFNKTTDSKNPLLKDDLKDNGPGSLEKRMDLMMRLVLNPENPYNTNTDFGVSVEHNGKVLFSRNCHEGRPKITILFE